MRICQFAREKDTIFSEAGIGIIPEGKFTKTATKTDLQDNELMKKPRKTLNYPVGMTGLSNRFSRSESS